jgi:Holliday junction DNA helicase RuvB
LFKKLFRKIGLSDTHYLNQHTPDMPPEERFFSSIVGYPEIKKLMMRAIISKEPSHILLTGPPASSKTIFLLEMIKGLDNAYFIDGVSSSGSGMIDYLFDHSSTKYLLIDEIDKMKVSDQVALLNVMETGILSETKSKRTKGSRQQKMNLWIFATSNDSERLSKPLKSRFSVFSLPEYTLEEFSEIAIMLLEKRYKIRRETATKISNSVWTRLNSKDVRDILKIGKLARPDETDADVDWLIDTYKKYTQK